LEEAGLRVTSHSPGDVVVLELTGELDVASAEVLDRCVSTLRPLTAPLTIDVSDLRFVDSSGLRALTAARRVAIEDTGAAVRLVGCSDMLRKLLTMSGLSEAFLDVDG
jgi:anti-sigma B factor antagonist